MMAVSSLRKYTILIFINSYRMTAIIFPTFDLSRCIQDVLLPPRIRNNTTATRSLQDTLLRSLMAKMRRLKHVTLCKELLQNLRTIFRSRKTTIHTKLITGKVHPITGHEGTDKEQKYTLSLTSAMDGVGSQRDAPDALPLKKIRCPLYRRLGPTACLGGCEKYCHHRGSNPGTLEPVTSRIPTTLFRCTHRTQASQIS